MVKKSWIILGIIFLLVLAGGIYVKIDKPFQKSDDFSKTSLIRLNIPIGGEINTSVKITNPEKDSEIIKISLNNFDGLALLSQDEFSLDFRESDELIVEFKDLKRKPGVYVGKLVIENSLSKEEIPIILGVEDANAAFAIIQSSIPKYDLVYLGGKLGIDFKVFDLINSNVQTVKANYVIKNLDDESLLSGNTDLIVGTGSKSEIINIPKDWDVGDYVFISYIEHKGTLSFSSHLFTVSNPDNRTVLDNSKIFFIAVIIFVVLILFFVLYFVKTRDSLIIELKKQQDSELKRNLDYIKQSKKVIIQSKSNSVKKKNELDELKRAEKSIVKKLKDKQKKQKREIEKLKKSKTKEGKIKEKMNKWKNQGYKMYETDEELKKANKKGIKGQIKEWNKQGYDTGFLNK